MNRPMPSTAPPRDTSLCYLCDRPRVDGNVCALHALDVTFHCARCGGVTTVDRIFCATCAAKAER